VAIVIKIKRRPPRKRISKPIFALTAQPVFKTEGPTQGYLDGVIFTAQAPNALHKWLTPNQGNFIADFSALISKDKAVEILHDLHSGKIVSIPGPFRLDQLKDRFGFTPNAGK
jgi:hypothetical protein